MRKSDPSDPELLADWLKHQREPAFHELVARYAGLVHATARRTCGNESMAAEVSQLTFITLACKAKSLTSCASFGGWLHQTAMMHAKNQIRQKHRETRKRQHLAMEPEPSQSSGDAWKEMQPVLDDALSALSDKDREALLLRFYRSLTVREVATTLGIATDAAQKRIDRATERLRGKLTRRGCQAGGPLGAVMLAGFAADAQAAVLPVSMLASNAIVAGSSAVGIVSTFITFLTASTMKSTSAAIPIVILLGSGFWIACQFHAIARLEEANMQLGKYLTANDSVASYSTKRSSIKTALDVKPIDWEEVARQLAKDRGGWAPLTTNLRLLDALQSMSESELIAGLDEIAIARLSPKSRELLDKRLGTLLMTKNPERGLTRFIRHCHDSNWSWLLGSQLGSWAKVNPDRAVAWFSAQIAAGSFDRTSPAGGLDVPRAIVHPAVFGLLDSAPDAAGCFLSALPEDARLKSLVSVHNIRLRQEESLSLKWAEMVRQHLPESDRVEAITWPIANWSDGDGRPMNLSETSAYLTRIGATAEETDACVLCVAGQVHSWRPFFTNDPKTPTEGIQALRAWVAIEAPDMLDRATAAALGAQQAMSYEGGDHFPELAKLALHYRETGGGDELLIPLLEASGAAKHKELARTLAARLTDETLREKHLDHFKPTPVK